MTTSVLYGGAHLFSAAAPAKIAARALESFARSDVTRFGRALGILPGDEALAAEVHARVGRKLAAKAIESMCIDFEDGYGPRSDEEEDADAVRTAKALAQSPTGSPIIGMRIKANARGERTLRLFLENLGPPPPGFTVTLPKVEGPADIERVRPLLRGIPIELMIETSRAVKDIPALLVDGVRAIHLGAYDLTAELGVAEGRLDHPFCDHARTMMQLAVAGTDIVAVDGATTLLPTGEDPHAAWAAHARNVTRAIDFGIWCGWDLHPAQLPARYGALFAYILARRDVMTERLARFNEKAAQATRLGQVFDDAATARGLNELFRRAREIGAIE